MNTVIDKDETEAKASPIDLYRVQVLPPEKATDLWKSLPHHISPAVFERNLTNALMANTTLLTHNPRLVFREVSKAAGLGLLLDPQLGEAYMVTAYNYRTKRSEPQLRIGYRGMCKLARQTGNVKAIYVHEVCENDEIECDLGHPKTLHHRPRLFKDRGDVIGYLAVIAYKDEAFDFEPMSVKQTRAIRDRSDAWKAFQDGKIKSTPWSTDEEEMAKKTTLRRLMKRQDLSPEMRTAIEIEDRAEFPELRAIRIDHDDGPPAPPPAPQIPPPTPDVVEGGDDQSPPAPPEDDGPPAPPAQSAATPPANKTPEPPVDGEAFLLWVKEILADVADPEVLADVWNAKIEPRLTNAFPPDREEALGLYRRRERELEP